VDIQAADILEQAAGLIRDVGWCQGRAVRYAPDGTNKIDGYCAIGAIQHVALSGVRSDLQQAASDAAFHAQDHLKRCLGLNLNLMSIPGWNDADGRTQEEVVEAMLHAAKELRNG
jgi:hypothetical protein